MKNITEFNVFNLNRAVALKNELATQGKTPEEVQTGIGEAFKLEGDKLKYFVNSLELVTGKTEGLKRVLVVSFGEGETVPDKVQKVEDQHFLLEYFTAPRPPAPKDDGNKRGGKGRGPRGGGGPRRDGPRGEGKGPGAPKEAKKDDAKS